MFCSRFLPVLCFLSRASFPKTGVWLKSIVFFLTPSSILCLKLCYSTQMFYFSRSKVLKCLHYSFSVGLVWLSWLKVLKASSASEQAIKDKASSWPFFFGEGGWPGRCLVWFPLLSNTNWNSVFKLLWLSSTFPKWKVLWCFHLLNSAAQGSGLGFSNCCSNKGVWHLGSKLYLITSTGLCSEPNSPFKLFSKVVLYSSGRSLGQQHLQSGSREQRFGMQQHKCEV